MKKISNLFIAIVSLAYTVSATAQNVPSYIPTNGLVGWWPFNGNANDESGNGNDGAVNGPNLTIDRFGNGNKAYSFDGVNDFIDVPNSNSLQSPNTSITISAWFKINDWDNIFPPLGYASFISKSDINSVQYRLSVSTIDFSFIINGTNWKLSYSQNSVQLGTWYNLVVTLDNNVYSFFLNGSFLGVNNNQNAEPFGVSQNVEFGRDQIGGVDYFNGELDDIAIWNRALTPQEITALYTASPTNNNETSNTTANVPGAISYQAVARDAQGAPLADANLQVRFTLIADSLSGSAEYAETHSLTTNSLGLFTTAFGAGTPVSNTFGNINWSAGNKFLKVQIDTGNGFVDIGTQQLLSTPYSMHSATSGAIKNPGLPVFADNAAALAGGLVAGDMYRTASGDLKIVY